MDSKKQSSLSKHATDVVLLERNMKQFMHLQEEEKEKELKEGTFSKGRFIPAE